MTVEKQFYYIRSNGEPTVTVCLLKREGEEGYARGVAICSPHDNPVKSVGRSLAENRAKGVITRNAPIPFGTFRSHHNLGGVVYSAVYMYEDAVIDGLLEALESPNGGVEDGCLATPNAHLTTLEQALLAPKPEPANAEV